MVDWWGAGCNKLFDGDNLKLCVASFSVATSGIHYTATEQIFISAVYMTFPRWFHSESICSHFNNYLYYNNKHQSVADAPNGFRHVVAAVSCFISRRLRNVGSHDRTKPALPISVGKASYKESWINNKLINRLCLPVHTGTHIYRAINVIGTHKQ